MNKLVEVVYAVPKFYNYVFYELADVRSHNFNFLTNPLQVFGLLVLYNVFVLNIGQKWMKDRQPYNIKKIIFLYDLFQIIANLFIFFKLIQLGWLWKFPLLCFEVGPDNEETRELASVVYYYYLIKISDVLDTVFFIFTKKFSHISFLHVYHHTGMIAVGFMGVKYIPGGHTTFIGLINSFIHVVMYTYYLVTTIYPQKKLFAVKKVITQMQMYQFLLIFLHTCLLALPSCSHFPRIALLLLPNNLMIFILFYNFYRKSYFPKKKQN